MSRGSRPGPGDRMVCPDCGKKGVTLRWARVSGDYFECRYCHWSAYASGYDEVDVAKRYALDALNPTHRHRPDEHNSPLEKMRRGED